MLNRDDLREYRLMSGLTYRDVARYCELSFQTIQQIEAGERNVTAYNNGEIIKGINRAKQAKADGTFDADKKKETNATKKRTASESPGKTTK